MADKLTQAKAMQLSFRVGEVFTPAIPVKEDRLFAGRRDQIHAIIDAINQRGQHAVLYGERGVGKTSLANVLESFLKDAQLIAPRVNCASSDSFSSLWQRMFAQIKILASTRTAGFRGQTGLIPTAISSLIDASDVTVDMIRGVVDQLSQHALLALIFDEFDTIKKVDVRRAMAELIKLFSDYDIRATLVLVGVGDSVKDLIREHTSIERAIVQVRMPRMSDEELVEILNVGTKSLGMRIAGDAVSNVVQLSKGLPHYTHLLGLHATRKALARNSLEVSDEDVNGAIEASLEKAHQTTIDAYNLATHSVRSKHLFKEVLLACALAPADEVGWFTASAVREPLRAITKISYDIPAYVRHLNAFTTNERGRILQKSGAAHKYRFRFDNPLMQPFIILRGHRDGMIPE